MTTTFRYQWRQNGLPIPGATAATYVQTSALGPIDCVVTGENAAGETTILSEAYAQLLVPVSLTGVVLIGNSPITTPPVYAPAIDVLYTYRRDGVPVAGLTDVSLATINAHVFVAADIGPILDVVATPTAGPASISGAIQYDSTTDLPENAIGVSTTGILHSGGTVQSWASSYGGVSATLSAPAPTNEPAYSATGGVGGRPLVTFDGVDNVLAGTVTKGSPFSSYEIGFVGSRVAFINNNFRVFYYGSTIATYSFGIVERTTTIRHLGPISQDFPGSPAVVSNRAGMSTATEQFSFVNGATTAGPVAVAFAGAVDGGVLGLGGQANGTFFTNIAVQAWYIGPALTTNQRANLTALLTYLTGV